MPSVSARCGPRSATWSSPACRAPLTSSTAARSAASATRVGSSSDSIASKNRSPGVSGRWCGRWVTAPRYRAQRAYDAPSPRSALERPRLLRRHHLHRADRVRELEVRSPEAQGDGPGDAVLRPGGERERPRALALPDHDGEPEPALVERDAVVEAPAEEPLAEAFREIAHPELRTVHGLDRPEEGEREVVHRLGEGGRPGGLVAGGDPARLAPPRQARGGVGGDDRAPADVLVGLDPADG